MIDSRNNGTARGPRPGTWWKKVKLLRDMARGVIDPGTVSYTVKPAVYTRPDRPQKKGSKS